MEQDELSPEHAEQQLHPARDADEPPEDSAPELVPSELTAAEQGALLTALLFSAGEVLSAPRLAEYFNVDPAELDVLAAEAAGRLRPLGLDILQAAGGLRLVTASQWDAQLSGFHRSVRKGRLSKSALEILAVVAYEQPVTRSRIDELRQVSSESTLRTLLDKRLITVAGRAETPGRPFLYRTTDTFLETFGLLALSDLPPRPASFAAAESLSIGRPDDQEPASLDDLPGFDADDLATGELED